MKTTDLAGVITKPELGHSLMKDITHKISSLRSLALECNIRILMAKIKNKYSNNYNNGLSVSQYKFKMY